MEIQRHFFIFTLDLIEQFSHQEVISSILSTKKLTKSNIRISEPQASTLVNIFLYYFQYLNDITLSEIDRKYFALKTHYCLSSAVDSLSQP